MPLSLCPRDLFGYDATIRAIHPAPGIHQKDRITPKWYELEAPLR
jgi:hypothetical protein